MLNLKELKEKMPFMKKKKEEEDEVPRERAERTEKMTREVRGEPEFDEYEEDYEDEEEEQPKRGRSPPPRRVSQRSRAVVDSLDLAAHIFLVNSFARQYQGWPQHLADAEMQRVCGAHLKRIKELNESL